MFGIPFGNKTYSARKRHTAAYYVVGVFTFAIEFMLGVNAAFLIDQSISIVAQNMLQGTSLQGLSTLITLVASLSVGFCFVFGGMWVFSGFMDTLEDAKAYRNAYGSGRWPTIVIWSLFIAIIALDFTTLMFRASYFAEKGAVALLAFFIILIFMPPLLGPLIHVLEHTPRDRRLAKARERAEALDTAELERVVQVMDADLRSRWIGGDVAALEEHYERVEAERMDNKMYEQAVMEQRQQAQARKNAPLPLPSGTNTTRPLA